jgi:hypothetical protein
MFRRVLLGLALVLPFYAGSLAATIPNDTIGDQGTIAVVTPLQTTPYFGEQSGWSLGSPPVVFSSEDGHRYLHVAANDPVPPPADAKTPTTVEVTASPDTTVDIQGSWFADLIPIVGSILMLVITWAFRFLPGYIRTAIQLLRLDQVLARSIDVGIARVQGAVKGQTWSVDVGNAVVAAALENFLASAPASLVEWAGGKEGLIRKILARITDWLPKDFGDVKPTNVNVNRGVGSDPVAPVTTNFDGRFTTGAATVKTGAKS